MNNPVEEHLLNISRRQFFGKMAQGIGAMALGSLMSDNIFAAAQSPSWLLSYFLNWKIEGATGRRDWPEVMPVMRWSPRTVLGNSLSNCDWSSGL